MARDPLRLREQAKGHPTRRRILALFKENERRSLAAADLLRDLRAAHPDEYKGIKPKQIHYHRARLQDAELLPG
jgi:DNA-binding transcriptional ArsR family regulator